MNLSKQTFAFEDLALLDDRAIRLVVREISTEDLALALRNASEETKTKIFLNIPLEDRDKINDELNNISSSIFTAQRVMADIAMSLAEEGKIGRPGKKVDYGQSAKTTFSFEDLVYLDDRSTQLVLREVEFDTLVAALKTSREELKDKVFSNLPLQAVEHIKNELAKMATPEISVIWNAQQAIADTALALEKMEVLRLPTLRGDQQ